VARARLSQSDVVRLRLAGQRLMGARASDPVALVREQGAVQAQDYAGAKWGLGLRLSGARDASVEEAIDSGRILRTHVLRPTWHFVAAEDIRWMLALTGPQIQKRMAAYDRQLGLDAKVMAKGIDAIARALGGGRALTRGELRAVLVRARIKDPNTQKLAHLMMGAELASVICSGPRRGKESTYALIDERAPKVVAPERDDALGEMARRYFGTRGPATVQDFMWWSGLRAADARRGIDIAGNALVAASYDDRLVWFTERRLPKSAPIAHLLPNYDEYFIGHRDRSAIGRRVRNIQDVAGNAFFAHLVFVNGELVGGWKRVNTRTGIEVRFAPATKLTAAEQKLVEKAVNQFAVFVGQEVRLA
jgi:hypothetical protein